MKRPILISITGNIASGKSYVAHLLELLGFKVIYADKLGHKALEEKAIIDDLVNEFGSLILNDIKKIDRKKLGKIVFGNSGNLKKLNAIVHPYIRKMMQNKVEEFKGKFLFYEVPLLFESGLQKCFDYNVLISIDKNMQKKRLYERDGFSEKEIEKRLKSQYSNAKKKDLCDYIIDNNSDKKNLKRQVNLFLSKIDTLPSHKITKFTKI